MNTIGPFRIDNRPQDSYTRVVGEGSDSTANGMIWLQMGIGTMEEPFAPLQGGHADASLDWSGANRWQNHYLSGWRNETTPQVGSPYFSTPHWYTAYAYTWQMFWDRPCAESELNLARDVRGLYVYYNVQTSKHYRYNYTTDARFTATYRLSQPPVDIVAQPNAIDCGILTGTTTKQCTTFQIRSSNNTALPPGRLSFSAPSSTVDSTKALMGSAGWLELLHDGHAVSLDGSVWNGDVTKQLIFTPRITTSGTGNGTERVSILATFTAD